MTGLAGAATKRVGRFSLGMSQRLGIAADRRPPPRDRQRSHHRRRLGPIRHRLRRQRRCAGALSARRRALWFWCLPAPKITRRPRRGSSCSEVRPDDQDHKVGFVWGRAVTFRRYTYSPSVPSESQTVVLPMSLDRRWHIWLVFISKPTSETTAGTSAAVSSLPVFHRRWKLGHGFVLTHRNRSGRTTSSSTCQPRGTPFRRTRPQAPQDRQCPGAPWSYDGSNC